MMKMKRIRGKKIIALLAASLTFGLAGASEAASLSVAEAVDMALEQNLSVKIQEVGEETARAVLKAARANNSISISANGSLNAGRENNSPRRGTGSGSLSAKFPLYTGGKNENDIKSGEIGMSNAFLKTSREMEDVRLSVIKAYYDVLEAKKTVDVNSEAVDNYAAHLNNVRQLYTAGSKAKIDLLRSSVELANAKQKLIKSQNTYEINISTLKNILCMNQNEPLELTEDFSYVEFRPGLLPCVDYALKSRKDLIVGQNEIKQHELDIKNARAGYLPSISLSASTNGSHTFIPDKDDNHGYSGGVSVSWNIFDAGATQAAIDRAKASHKVAMLSHERDKNNVDLSVRQAYYNMREAEKRFASSRAAVGQAQEDYFISREKYRVGEGLLLDVIDAQLALSTAQLNYISAQYDYVRYLATVENAIGLGIGENINEVLPVAVSEANIPIIIASMEEAKRLVPEQALPVADFTLPDKADEDKAVPIFPTGEAGTQEDNNEVISEEIAQATEGVE